MSGSRPRHLASPQDLVAVLGLAHGLPTLAARLHAVSGYLLGRPYAVTPLIGSPSEPEVLVTRLDAFDCVTFVETVLALATAARPEELEIRLRHLRYEGGRVAWASRNHYTSQWMERNEAAGLVCPVAAEAWITEPNARVLDALDGYPSQRRRLSYLPLEALAALEEEGRSGDVVGFVSTRPHLDVFHVGLLARTGDGGLRLRHASRSAGQVVDQGLDEFIAGNELPGVMVVRPRAADALSPAPGGSS